MYLNVCEFIFQFSVILFHLHNLCELEFHHLHNLCEMEFHHEAVSKLDWMTNLGQTRHILLVHGYVTISNLHYWMLDKLGGRIDTDGQSDMLLFY
jgi:hypothetical protein